MIILQLFSCFGKRSRIQHQKHAGLELVISVVLLLSICQSPQAASEPFLHICLNVSNVLALTEDKMAEMEKSGTIKATTNNVDGAGSSQSSEEILKTIKSLQIDTVHVFLYPDEEFKVVPVFVFNHLSREVLDPMLADKGVLSHVFIKEKDGVYKFKEQAVSNEVADAADKDGGIADKVRIAGQAGEAAAKNDSEFNDRVPDQIPTDRFRLWLSKAGAIIAPTSVAQSWTNAQSRPRSSAVAKLTIPETSDDLLVTLSALMPDKIKTNLVEDLYENPLLENEAAAAVASIGAQMLEEITAPLRQIKAFSFSMSLKKDKTRSVRYVQWYRTKADAIKAHARLKGDADSKGEKGIVSALVNATKDKAVTSDFVLQNNDSVLISAAWSKTNDEKVVSPLIGAIMQTMFGLDGTITCGPAGPAEPMETKYIQAPVFEAAMDIVKLQAILKKEVSSRIFFDEYSLGYGEGPFVSFDFDYFEFPNAVLSDVKYDIISVTAQDGSSVQGKAPEQRARLIEHEEGGLRGGILVPVMSGVKEDLLDKASVRFTFLVPGEFVVFDVSTNDLGKRLAQKGCSVTLKSIDGSDVSVASSGGELVKLFACDKTGQFLEKFPFFNSWNDSIADCRFFGVPASLKVVVIKKMETIQVDVPINLQKGKRVEFPREPSTAVPNRFVCEQRKQYKTYSDKQLVPLKVDWENTEREEDFEGDLSIALDEATFDGKHDWKVFYFGNDKPLCLEGNGGWTGAMKGSRLYYSPQDGKKAGIHGAYGFVNIAVPGEITRLSFDRTEGTSAVVRITALGTKVSVTFNKNHIIMTAPNEKVLDVQVINSEGRALKREGGYIFNGVAEYQYWGQPAKVIVCLADKQIKRRIPVDLTREGIDLKAFESFKTNVDSLCGAVRTLESIKNGIGAGGRSYFHDDTLAGFYYMLDADGVQAKFIDVAIAHSDPAGQARYGYQVKPYNGYYFTVAKGTENEGKQSPYKRRDHKKEMKWEKGSFTMDLLDDSPALMAIPVDKKGAVVAILWASPRGRFLDGATLEYVPEEAFPKGWMNLQGLSYP